MYFCAIKVSKLSSWAEEEAMLSHAHAAGLHHKGCPEIQLSRHGAACPPPLSCVSICTFVLLKQVNFVPLRPASGALSQNCDFSFWFFVIFSSDFFLIIIIVVFEQPAAVSKRRSRSIRARHARALRHDTLWHARRAAALRSCQQAICDAAKWRSGHTRCQYLQIIRNA